MQQADELSKKSKKLYDVGAYGDAIEPARQAVELSRQALGPVHPVVASYMNNLAATLDAAGDSVGALELVKLALEIEEAVLGPDDPRVAQTRNNVAVAMRGMGDFAGARLLLEKTLKIQGEKLAPDHPDTAITLAKLAALHSEMGDYREARPLYERALKILEHVFGPNSREVANTLLGLGTALYRSGDSPGALEANKRALSIREELLGPNHPQVADSLNALAVIYRTHGYYAMAYPLYKRALEINERVYGPDHPEAGRLTANLAVLLRAMGDSDAAQPLFERTLVILEKTLGPSHPDLGRTLLNLAELAQDRNQGSYAVKLLDRAVNIVEVHTQRGLVGLSDRQKLAFVRTTDQYLAGYLSLSADLVPASRAYEVVQTRKNAIFRVLAQERSVITHAVTPPMRALLMRRQRLTSELTGLTFRSQPAREKISALEKELERVEAELSRDSGSFLAEEAETNATADAICRALPRDAVLLDYVRYNRYIPKKDFFQASRYEDGYTVFVLRGGKCPNIQRVELGPAKPIDEAAMAFRESLTKLRQVENHEEPLPEGEILAKSRTLATLVLPSIVRKAFVRSPLVIIAPDGPLAVVPFRLLTEEDGRRYLIETYQMVTIPSGRDLLHLGGGTGMESAEEPGALLLVGNPDYGAKIIAVSGQADGRRSAPRAGCGLEMATEFAQLPGTAIEVAAIAGQAAATLKRSTILRAEGEQATEPWLVRQLSGQRFVHLATHGYFAGEACQSKGGIDTRGVQVSGGQASKESDGFADTNPLLLSGIAMAGANRRAQASSGAEDGILTALEVTNLDLRGTELVTLSACETGLGVQNAGQELMGLRWAFRMAGARTLLSSLWQVPDEPTVQLMKKFYSHLWRSGKASQPLGKAAALRRAQLELIKENRARYRGDSRPIDWGAWVLSGDWR